MLLCAQAAHVGVSAVRSGAGLLQACPLRRRRWQRPKKNQGLGAKLRTVCGGQCPRVLSDEGQTAWPNGQAGIEGFTRSKRAVMRVCRDVETMLGDGDCDGDEVDVGEQEQDLRRRPVD